MEDLQYIQDHKNDENNFKDGSFQKENIDSKNTNQILKDWNPLQSDPLFSERHESENRFGLKVCEIDMTVLEEAKKRRIALILKRLGVYGELWEENKKYDDDRLYYEGGTPDRMWLYPWTDGLDDLNHYVQVNLIHIQVNLLILISLENGISPPDGHGSH